MTDALRDFLVSHDAQAKKHDVGGGRKAARGPDRVSEYTLLPGSGVGHSGDFSIVRTSNGQYPKHGIVNLKPICMRFRQRRHVLETLRSPARMSHPAYTFIQEIHFLFRIQKLRHRALLRHDHLLLALEVIPRGMQQCRKLKANELASMRLRRSKDAL